MENPKKAMEFLDDTPVAIPVRITRPPTRFDEIRSLVRGTMSQVAQEQGFESFEEANDFDVGEDYDPQSPWEIPQDHEDNVAEVIRAQRAASEPPKPAVGDIQTPEGGGEVSPAGGTPARPAEPEPKA